MKRSLWGLLPCVLAAVSSLLWLSTTVLDVTTRLTPLRDAALHALTALIWAAVAVLWFLRWRKKG